MTDSFLDKPERPWPNPYLEVAAIVGHTTTTCCRLWFRTHQSGQFQILLFCPNAPANEALDALLRQPTLSLADLPTVTDTAQLSDGGVALFPFTITHETAHDSTHVETLTGLQPLTDYRYLLWDELQGRCLLGHQRAHGFRTLSDQPGPTSFAFFSCHMPYRTTLFGRTKAVNEEMWDYLATMLQRHRQKALRFIIAGGDQVYSDGVETLNIWKYLRQVMRREDGRLLPEKKSMVSWYRDIYRGYWGFAALREVFSSFPTYMIWDDHEISDGWGSRRLKPGSKELLRDILPELEEKGLSEDDGRELLARMFRAAKQVYGEYQHSHNPDMSQANPSFPPSAHDYHFSFPAGAVYVLDGRGQRNFDRSDYKILGREQFERFTHWLETLSIAETPFVFIVSAVPMIHLSHLLVDQGEGVIARKAGLSDDIRDGWEHPAHRRENRRLLKQLFKAARKGHRICILSGDVHIAAAFRLTDPDSKQNNVVYQLTSSAITYNLPRAMGWGLGLAVPDEGETRDGYHFERLARYSDSNFSLIRVLPEKDRVDFQLYGEKVTANPDGGMATADSHSIAKIELHF